MLLQFLADGLVNGCLYALLAMGFALIYNTTRIFHVAHGAVYATAVYLSYIFIARLHWGLLIAGTTVLIISGFLGILIERLIYFPLEQKKASLLVSLLSSLGLYIVAVNLIVVFMGSETRVLLSDAPKTFHAGALNLTGIQIGQVLSAISLLAVLTLLLTFTRFGRIIRAVRDNPTLLVVMGFDLFTIRLLVFGLGSGLAGIAAFLTALDKAVNPHIGMPALLTAAVAFILGGIGTFRGALVGGLLLGVLESVVTWKYSAHWNDAIMYGALVLVLLFRPQGLVGQRHRLEGKSA